VTPSTQPAETLVARSDATVELLIDHPSVAVSTARFSGRGPMPPQHAHAEHTEVFLVLDGALRLVIASDETLAGAGTVVVVPPGVAHTFATDGGARFLDLHAPSRGYGAFLRALATAADEDEQARARAAFDQHPAPAGGGGTPHQAAPTGPGPCARRTSLRNPVSPRQQQGAGAFKPLSLFSSVASVPGSAFFHDEAGERFLRFCFAKDDAELAAAAERLLTFSTRV